MFSRTFVIRFAAFAIVFCCASLVGQSQPGHPKPPATNSALVQEFPVTMRENVVAGKTPVGTKVEAKLTIATLFEGTVIPMDATFSGEVTESREKSETEPSHLAIRMDSVRWKTGSKPVKLFLTAWYYPLRLPTDENRSNDPLSGARGPYGPTAPFPGHSSDSTGPDIGPTSSVSDTRVVMKDVTSTRNDDGSLVLVSTRFNLKLNKSTTYVLATGSLTPGR